LLKNPEFSTVFLASEREVNYIKVRKRKSLSFPRRIQKGRVVLISAGQDTKTSATPISLKQELRYWQRDFGRLRAKIKRIGGRCGALLKQMVSLFRMWRERARREQQDYDSFVDRNRGLVTRQPANAGD
jgi:hypothetical protein